MRFKIDENLPTESAQLLTDAGHDAKTIHDQQMVGEVDARVSSVCRSEHRVLVTLDLDFADIRTYPPAEHHGIVVLRLRTQAKPAVMQLLAQLIRLLPSSHSKATFGFSKKTACASAKARWSE